LVTFCVGTAFIKHVIEGKIEGTLEVTGRWGRRGKQLLVVLKWMRMCYKLKEEALGGELDLRDAMEERLQNE
jgi:hypothetical protein